MDEDRVIEKLRHIFRLSSELRMDVKGNPALEGDMDRIFAISKEKLLLLDPENFAIYQRGEER